MTDLLTDSDIKNICEDTLNHPLLDPFVDHQVSSGVISYGLSSCGYDIRLSDTYLVFSPFACLSESLIIDPKRFDKRLFTEHKGDYCIIPPNSFCLSVSEERFSMPINVVGICIGKSTYARCGIIVNVTPIEPGWVGYLTIEISNTTPLPAKIYSYEGICQIQFWHIDEPDVTYESRIGKYQDQPKYPQIPKVKKIDNSFASDQSKPLIFDRKDIPSATSIVYCSKCKGIMTYKHQAVDNLGLCDSCAREHLKNVILNMQGLK